MCVCVCVCMCEREAVWECVSVCECELVYTCVIETVCVCVCPRVYAEECAREPACESVCTRARASPCFPFASPKTAFHGWALKRDPLGRRPAQETGVSLAAPAAHPASLPTGAWRRAL